MQSLIRRVVALLLIGTGCAVAQTATQPHVPMPLWPHGAPGSVGTEPEDTPTLAAYLPASNPTKTAVIIAPGGGYSSLQMKKEGEEIASWLAARGVAGFVLKYRIAPKYHHPAPINDAQRAIRTVRANALRYGIDPAHIGMAGFSAGGHLAATAGTQFDAGDPAASDPIERVSSRPDFLILGYAVISFRLPFGHIASANNLISRDPAPKLMDSLSAETRVTKMTPPTFLYSTEDDGTVQVMNSVLFYQALLMNGVSAEMHIYRHGPHGSGLASGFPLLKGWPDVLAQWMAGNGWMAAEASKMVANP